MQPTKLFASICKYIQQTFFWKSRDIFLVLKKVFFASQKIEILNVCTYQNFPTWRDVQDPTLCFSSTKRQKPLL